MRTLPGCELQITSNTALREWDNQQSAFQALLSWACGGRVNTVLSPYDAASGDSWWPVTTALSPRDTCDVWVTCWVHVLTGDHRCPRKSVLLRRNSNTCNVRLHLYVEQFVRCQLASFPEYREPECEGAAAFPGFRVVRLRVNMVIVWGEEREMRDERRELWDQRGEQRDGAKITAAEDDCFCRTWTHLSWFSSLQDSHLTSWSFVAQKSEHSPMTWDLCSVIKLCFQLFCVGWLCSLRSNENGMINILGIVLPGCRPVPGLAASEQLKLSQDLIVLDTAQPVQGRWGQGSDTETWQLQDLYLVLQKKKDIYTFILCCTSIKAGLITWAFLMGWQKQMLPGSEIVANVLSRWLERLVQGYSLNPGMISIFSIFRSKASVKLTFYWCQKMQKTFNAATNDKETSWWCSL